MDIYEVSEFIRIRGNAERIARMLDNLAKHSTETARKYNLEGDINAYFIYTGNAIAFDISKNIVMDLINEIAEMAKIISVEGKNNG